MTIWNWLNNKRLRDYPRLILIASWLVIILNVLLHHGWIGGLTGIMIGGDFISNYSGGNLYLTDISHLYDPAAQQANQTSLIAPEQSPGFAPFISPPYVALAASWMTSIPLSYAFAGWEILNLICILINAYLIYKFIFPSWLMSKDMSPIQLSIIILSSFAFVVGFLAGQSHGIILLLCVGIILAMIKEKWVLAGLLGSMLTYKPQFVLGFLICWLVWGCIKSLISFAVFTLLWQIPIILSHGLSPYIEYLKFTKILLYLPYAKDGFPISIMSTPYAFLATLFPIDFAKVIQFLLILIGIGMVIFLAFIAYKSKKLPITERYFTMSMALLFPLIIAPHTLIYDLLILVPALIILANIQEITQSIKLLAVIFYICLLFLPIIGYLLKLALPGLIPLTLLIYMLSIYFRSNIIAESS
jgi:hypothetical protein